MAFLRRFSFFLIFLWFTFNFDFIFLSLLLSFELLALIIIFSESKEVFNCLSFTNWRRQIGKTISQENAIASVMKNIFSYHLWQRLLLSFLFVKLCDFHQFFSVHILKLKSAFIKFHLSMLWIVIYKVIHDAFEF